MDTYIAVIDSDAQTILGTTPTRPLTLEGDAAGKSLRMVIDVPIERKGWATHAIIVKDGSPWDVNAFNPRTKVKRWSDLTVTLEWHLTKHDDMQLPASGMLPSGMIELGAGA